MEYDGWLSILYKIAYSVRSSLSFFNKIDLDEDRNNLHQLVVMDCPWHECRIRKVIGEDRLTEIDEIGIEDYTETEIIECYYGWESGSEDWEPVCEECVYCIMESGPKRHRHFPSMSDFYLLCLRVVELAKREQAVGLDVFTPCNSDLYELYVRVW